MNNVKQHPAWLFVLFPAVTMLLGWGLRGTIGGGPYGALIPGALVALSLALLLSYRKETAALAALFGAIGIGYGGNMTYGQTLGFLRESDTIYWGVLGCLVKGTVWGLLGGAVLGVGLARDHYDRKTVVLAFLLAIPAFLLGLLLVNEPKLLYFSDRVNEPRDESWAGLLFAALAILAFLRARGSKKAFEIPLHFALWGAIGGGLGFGGGCLWLAFGKYIPVDQKFIGWWKMMEFSFGFIFGAALGWCTWLNRARLQEAGQNGATPPEAWGPCIGFIAYVVALFGGYMLFEHYLEGVSSDQAGALALIVRTGLSLLFGYVLFATVAILLGLHSLQAAWQVAITMTFFHTVLDYTRDLSDAGRFGYTLSGAGQLLVLVVCCAILGGLSWRFMREPNAVQRQFLLVLWACYLTSCVRAFGHKDFVFPPEGATAWTYLVQGHPGLIFVQLTFTVSALIATWFALTRFPESEKPLAA